MDRHTKELSDLQGSGSEPVGVGPSENVVPVEEKKAVAPVPAAAPVPEEEEETPKQKALAKKIRKRQQALTLVYSPVVYSDRIAMREQRLLILQLSGKLLSLRFFISRQVHSRPKKRSLEGYVPDCQLVLN